MKLLLIRHGDPDYIHDDLTPAGRREAALLAERIAPMEVEQYIVSPLGRARATAARPELDGLSQVPWDWLPQDWLQDPRLFSPERWRENEILRAAGVGEAYDAVITAFDKLLAEHGYERDGLYYRARRPNTKTLVFFTHFGLSCVLLSHLMQTSPMVLWQGLVMAPSSVTTIHTEERRPGIAAFRTAALGDVSHLYAKGVEPAFAARFCEVYGNGQRID